MLVPAIESSSRPSSCVGKLENYIAGGSPRAARRAARRARRSAFGTAGDARHEHGRYQEANHNHAGAGARFCFWAYNDG